MPLFEIKHRFSGSVLFSLECGSLKLCVEAAVKSGADLRSADLRSADLSSANLRSADLRSANLSLADLSSADLRSANLSLANLRSANLRSANLRSADLSLANLQPIKDDFFAVLSYAPAETAALITALDTGRINGSAYSDGECGCLIGTLSIASGTDPSHRSECERVDGLGGNSSRPAERFFLSINRGDTPETNMHAKIAREWAQEWLDRMHGAFTRKQESAPAPTEQAAP